MKKSIFRNYDIRGIVNQDINAADVQCLGYLFAREVAKNGFDTIAVGRDVRLSSKEFSLALIEGITQGAVNVIDFGELTTPMLYYATIKKEIHNCMMVTASHNPKEFNGLKLMLGDKQFFGDALQSLYKTHSIFRAEKNIGSVSTSDITSDYVKDLFEHFDFSNPQCFPKVIIDPGHGATCEIIKSVADSLPGKYSIINNTPDGNFPSHEPDPSSIRNLTSLYNKVILKDYDLGIAFDCDGDRIALLTNNGRLLRGDEILFFIANYLYPAEKQHIVVDTRCSYRLTNMLQEKGFIIDTEKTGNPYIKQGMYAKDALLGAELSGHIMFKDWFNLDDGIFAMLAIINIISKKNLDTLSKIPEVYRTNDIKIKCRNLHKHALNDLLRDFFINNKKNFIDVIITDGIKIMNSNGSISFRPSNSEDIFTIVIEGNTKEELVPLKQYVNSVFEELKLDVTIA